MPAGPRPTPYPVVVQFTDPTNPITPVKLLESSSIFVQSLSAVTISATNYLGLTGLGGGESYLSALLDVNATGAYGLSAGAILYYNSSLDKWVSTYPSNLTLNSENSSRVYLQLDRNNGDVQWYDIRLGDLQNVDATATANEGDVLYRYNNVWGYKGGTLFKGLEALFPYANGELAGQELTVESGAFQVTVSSPDNSILPSGLITEQENRILLLSVVPSAINDKLFLSALSDIYQGNSYQSNYVLYYDEASNSWKSKEAPTAAISQLYGYRDGEQIGDGLGPNSGDAAVIVSSSDDSIIASGISDENGFNLVLTVNPSVINDKLYLSSLADTNIVALNEGYLLAWDGTAWVASALGAVDTPGGDNFSIQFRYNSSFSGSPLLIWDVNSNGLSGTNATIQNLSASIISATEYRNLPISSHSQLLNLTALDHPQYETTSYARNNYATTASLASYETTAYARTNYATTASLASYETTSYARANYLVTSVNVTSLNGTGIFETTAYARNNYATTAQLTSYVLTSTNSSLSSLVNSIQTSTIDISGYIAANESVWAAGISLPNQPSSVVFVGSNGTSLSANAGIYINNSASTLIINSDAANSIGGIDLYPQSTEEGFIRWDPDYDTLGVQGFGDTRINLGVDEIIPVLNNTGSQIKKGQICYVSGSSGGTYRGTISLLSTNFTNPFIIGAALSNINNNVEGYLIKKGLIKNAQISDVVATGVALTSGDTLYVSNQLGKVTNVTPSPGAHAATVGIFLASGSNQISYGVYVDKGYDLNQLHDVTTTAAQNYQFLTYLNGVWQPSSLDLTPYVLTSTNSTLSSVVNSHINDGSIHFTSGSLSSYYAASSWVDSNFISNTEIQAYATTASLNAYETTAYARNNYSLTSHSHSFSALSGLSDVQITSTPPTNYVLKWNGTKWAPAVDATGTAGGSGRSIAYIDLDQDGNADLTFGTNDTFSIVQGAGILITNTGPNGFSNQELTFAIDSGAASLLSHTQLLDLNIGNPHPQYLFTGTTNSSSLNFLSLSATTVSATTYNNLPSGVATWNANKIQSINVSSTTPNQGDILTYDGGGWAPINQQAISTTLSLGLFIQ